MADSAQPQLLICHACGDNWVRDSNHYDSRLLCPGCGSDFVQIIEEEDGGPPEREPEPERDSLPRSPLNPWADHNPWSRDIPSPFPHHHRQNNGSSAYDPMDFSFPVYSHHTYQSPDGRFSFSGTTMRGSFPPRQPHGYSNPMIPGGLQALRTILDDFLAEDAHQQRQRQRSSAENGDRNPSSDESPRRTSPNPDPAGIDEFAEFEGLFPRDTDRPQRMEHPVSDLSDLLDALRNRPGGRRRVAIPEFPATPMGPDPALMITELLRSLHEGRPSGRFGDAVYSREALDEVIAQLGQEHARTAGPPPASSTAIQSLPKKKINKQMLGSDGKAECAICKDTAELGTEVTTLPCEHWFHFDCIEAWLSRHNTCPNCRRSIDSPASPAEGTSDNQPTAQDNPDQQQQSSGRRRRRSSPFSRSSRSARSSFSRTSANSPTQETNEPSRSRRSSRGEGNHRGGFTGWVWSRFGGGSSS